MTKDSNTEKYLEERTKDLREILREQNELINRKDQLTKKRRKFARDYAPFFKGEKVVFGRKKRFELEKKFYGVIQRVDFDITDGDFKYFVVPYLQDFSRPSRSKNGTWVGKTRYYNYIEPLEQENK